MVRVGIINVTGYAGGELARLLHGHPEARLTSVSGRSAAGKPLAEVFPHLAAYDLTVGEEIGDVDFAFSALPHAASAEAVAPLIRSGLPIVDLSVDFRWREAHMYADWYGSDHPAPELLARAAYGLTELNRDAVSASRLVANPGCFPEGALLALAPAVKEGIVGPDIIIDSKSGVSGAGRTLKLASHFAEVDESVSAYGLEGHFHLPEIVQELTAMWPKAEAPQPPRPKVTFTPHLVPMSRGILSTCYASLLPGRPANGAQTLDLYREFYKGEPFVRVVDSSPATKYVTGSNLCLVHPTVDERTGRLVVVSVLDNLVKGAAGQAIQNMNAMLGLPETAGLEAPGVYP